MNCKAQMYSIRLSTHQWASLPGEAREISHQFQTSHTWHPMTFSPVWGQDFSGAAPQGILSNHCAPGPSSVLLETLGDSRGLETSGSLTPGLLEGTSEIPEGTGCFKSQSQIWNINVIVTSHQSHLATAFKRRRCASLLCVQGVF